MAKLLSGTRVYGNTTIDTYLVVNGANASNSTSTGSIQIPNGGIGVSGNINAGQGIFGSKIYDTTISNTITLSDTANNVTNSKISSNVATLRGEITANAGSANSVINANISANVATLRGEITANAASANSVINTNISANVATLRGEISSNVSTINDSITANAASANSVINTNISANVATLRGEITANAASANSVINTNISANVATLRGEITANVSAINGSITANAASANSVINTNISANVATLRGEITANATSANSVINTRITSNIATANLFTQAAFDYANSSYQTVTSNSQSRIVTTYGVLAQGKSVALDLANTGVTGGTYSYPSVQVDTYGRVITISSQTPVTTLSSNGQLTLSQTTGAVALGLANVNSNIGTYGGLNKLPVIVADGFGRVTSVTNTDIGMANVSTYTGQTAATTGLYYLRLSPQSTTGNTAVFTHSGASYNVDTSTITATTFAGNLSGYKNVDNANEVTIANGYASTGILYFNYRGATNRVTEIRFTDGKAAGVLTNVAADQVTSSNLISSAVYLSGNGGVQLTDSSSGTNNLGLRIKNYPSTTNSSVELVSNNDTWLSTWHGDTTAYGFLDSAFGNWDLKKTANGNFTIRYAGNAAAQVYFAGMPADVAVTDGGTGTSTAPTQGGVIYGASTTAYGSTAAGTANQVFASTGTTAPAWQSFDLERHAPDSSYKKVVRVATTADLAPSSATATTLVGYSNNPAALALTTTAGSTTITTTSTATIKVGAVTTAATVQLAAGTTVASILSATQFTVSNRAAITTTGITSAGTTATATFAAQTYAPYAVGSSIVVSGATPTNYNGTWVVTACSTTSVSFTISAAAVVTGLINLGSATTAGTVLQVSAVSSGTLGVGQSLTGTGITAGTTITALNAPASVATTGITSTASNFTVTTGAYNWIAGAQVTIAGVTPAGYNGTWTIATGGSGTFTVTSALNPGTATVQGTALGLGTTGIGYYTVSASQAVTSTAITTGPATATVQGSINFTIAAGTAISHTFTQTIAALFIDGVNMTAGDRLLVKDMSTVAGLGDATAGKYNGIYYVTTQGNVSTPWTLTRTPDSDSAGDMDSAIVNVSQGIVNGGKSFKTYFKGIDTLGTTPMYFNRFADVNASSLVGTPTTAVGLDLNSDAASANLVAGNVADLAINAIGVKTISATGASTYTRGSSLYIAGAPTAGTNATITNSYALYVVGGATYLGGATTVNSNFTVTAGTIIPAAGTTTLAPIRMTAGPVTTANTAGQIEYDGNAMYATTSGGHGRGVILAPLFTNGAGVTVATPAITTNYPIFPAAGDTVSVNNTTTYRVRGFFNVICAGTVANALNFDIKGAGTAVITSMALQVFATNANAVSVQTPTLTLITGTGGQVAITAASAAAATNRLIRVDGIIRITTTGTLIPSVSFSAAPGGALSFGDGYMEFAPIGTNTVAYSGAWS